MKIVGLALAATLALSTSALANQTKVATVTSVTPNYSVQKINTPVTRCENVEVPIYGTVQGGGATGGDVLTGMIIGGILGKGVTGKDNGAAAGAVMGGIIAADKGNKNKQVVTGYKTERQCYEVMEITEQTVIKNYSITYEWRGVTGSSYTYNRYNVGDRIPVEVRINAK